MIARLLSGLPPVFTRLLHCLRICVTYRTWQKWWCVTSKITILEDAEASPWCLSFPPFFGESHLPHWEDTQVTMERLRGETLKPLASGWTGALRPASHYSSHCGGGSVVPADSLTKTSRETLSQGCLMWLYDLIGPQPSCHRKTKQKKDEFHLLQEGNCTDKRHGPQALHTLCLMGELTLHPAQSFADFRATETVR